MGLLSSHRVSRVLWYSGYLPASPLFRLRDCHSLWSIFPNRSTRNDLSFASPYPRYIATSGLGCFPFARHYLGNRFYFLFLRVLRCFSSPGSPTYVMYSRTHTMSSTWWVPSFGNLRITDYLHLPVAYRSLSRPSSAPSAKASTLRSS